MGERHCHLEVFVMNPKIRALANEDDMRNRSPSLFSFNEKLLSDPHRLYHFKKFVESEYADEHLSFFLDCSEWKQLRLPNAKKARAEELLDLYVRPGAEHQINIEEKHLKNMTQAAQEGKYDDIFEVAMSEVYKLMKLDSYQRFSRSVFFEAMLTGSAVKEDAFGEEVFLKFMELCTGRDQPWTSLKKKGDAELFEQAAASKSADSGKLQLLKAVCEVAGTPQDVAEILGHPESMTKWDKDCMGAYEVERFSDTFAVVYVAYRGSVLGVAQTDFVLAQIRRDFSDGTVCILTRSIPNADDLVAEKKGFVRCHMETGGWMLDPVAKDPPRTRITSILELDYSGKANKRTMDAAKARLASIVALRDFCSKKTGPVSNRADRRRSLNL